MSPHVNCPQCNIVTVPYATYPVFDGSVTDTAVIVSSISARLFDISAHLSQVPPKSARYPLSPRAQQCRPRPTQWVSSVQLLRFHVFDAYFVFLLTNYTKNKLKYMGILDDQNMPVWTSSTSVVGRLSDSVAARSVRISAVNST